MKKQVAMLIFHGKYKVVYDSTRKMNPYSVIEVTWDKKQRQIERYADLDSALQYLTDMVRGGAR